MILGANPYASNGSLCTAPDFPGRLEALRARGGKVVVVDPRRTKTAEEADEWVAICAWHRRAPPHGDRAHAVRRRARRRGPSHPAVGQWLGGARVAALLGSRPSASRTACGVEATTIRRLAHELAGAPTATVYGRVGTCTQEFGTLASWLVDVVNVVTGNLDRPGGAMFSLPAAGGAATGRAGQGEGLSNGTRAHACARLAGGARGVSRRGAGRGDRD